MDYEKKYKEALKRASGFKTQEYKDVAAHIFPELQESEDEKIRKDLLNYLIGEFDKKGNESWDYDFHTTDIIAWLEKQVPINEEAEKEKNDYVSGQFLYCKGSFKEFKEGESYWIEYIGNDTYIGRSDNILNQKFHITPRQLYTWLDPRHPEKQGEQKPDDKSKIKPKFKTGDRVTGIVSGIPYFIAEVCNDHYNTESGCIIMFCSQDNFELYEQKSSEWSEEDQETIDYLIDYLEDKLDCSYTDLDKETFTKEITLLKSLKPQNTWKPSDEQMKALDIALKAGIQLGTWEEKALRELKEQLKKL